MNKGGTIALAIAAVLALAAFGPSRDVDGQRIATPADGEWLSHSRTYTEQRFSPLTAINSGNVGRLGVAWYHEFDTINGQEATPLVADGVLYTSTAWSKVYAFDAKTGKLLWSYDPEVPKTRFGIACCDAVNRGVALWRGKVYVGTFDGRLVALDAKTGKPVWTTLTFDQSQPYTITGAPRVVKGKVMIGNGGAEYGVRGYISAYDAETGKLAWRFYTVPNAEGKADGAPSDKPLAEKANATWFGTGWKTTGGGGTVWDAMAYDPEADLFYFGVGNGNPHNHVVRSDGKGDNLFLSSIVAIRPDTGEYVWHYQETPGESWDFTATQPIMLADLTIAGKRRKVLMQAPKNGFFYVLDRVTGELLSADAFSDVNWASGVDLKSGRPIENPAARYVKAAFDQRPGPLGAHGAHPWSFNPSLGLVYIPAQHLGFTYARKADYAFQRNRMNTGYDLSRSVMAPEKDAIAKARESVWGELVAWDPVARKARWVVRRPYFLNGGTLATGGRLVFQGTSDGHFEAFDAANGRKLWSYETGNGIVSGPISYAVDGEQYVAVLAGYGGPSAMTGPIVPEQPRLPGRLLVFKIGGSTKVPAYVRPARAKIDVAGVSSTGDPKAGVALFGQNCMACHGPSASSGYNADLRRSQMLTSAEAWRSVVIDGAFAENGMVSFADSLSPAQAEDIRAYVLTEARRAEAAERAER